MARPREHDRMQIAKDLLEWAKQSDSINLNKFCANNLIAPSKLSLFAKEDEIFRQAYELSKAFIAYRREEWLNQESLHVKAYDLNAATYDYFLREEKRLQAEFEANLKKETETNVSEEVKQMFSQTMNQLSSLQSERKIAESKIKIDTKS